MKRALLVLHFPRNPKEPYPRYVEHLDQLSGRSKDKIAVEVTVPDAVTSWRTGPAFKGLSSVRRLAWPADPSGLPVVHVDATTAAELVAMLVAAGPLPVPRPAVAPAATETT